MGTLVAGSGRNVIADKAKMQIEDRGETTELNNYMRGYTEDILAGAAKMYGCTYEIKLMGAADSLGSDEALSQRVARVCTEHLRLTCTPELQIKSTGSEDASYMMNRVQELGGQANFMRPLTKVLGASHNRLYDFDEVILGNAVKAFSGTVLDILG